MKNGSIAYPDKICQVDNGGLTISVRKQETRIEWGEVKSLVAFKVDKLTYDSIYLQIDYGENRSVVALEETEGWESLVKGVKANFPSVNPAWDIDIIQPPFAVNLTVLYKGD
jgi:hypothetical protein